MQSMDVDWDIDSVAELCSSKFIQDCGLDAFEDAGNLDWLDEKVDLSAWTKLDFPDDLTPVMLEDSDFQVAVQPDQSSNCSVAPKAAGFWDSQVASPCSPEFLSPPLSPVHSPSTPSAVVPNVDIFINIDSHNLRNSGASISSPTADTDEASRANSLSPPLTPSFSGVPPASVVVEVPYALTSAPASPSYFAAYTSPAASPAETSETFVEPSLSPANSVEEEILGNVKSEPTSPSCLSGSRVASPVECIVTVESASSPAPSTSTCPSFVEADNVDVLSPIEPSSPASCLSVPSPLPTQEELAKSPSPSRSADREDDGCDDDDDPMDADFIPEANRSDSESALDSASGSDEPPRKKKRTAKRRPRAKADLSSRKERKRLQNKDAATRYRQKKKQEIGKAEEELDKLMATNVSLQSEAQRITNEISYLKGLMRELFRAKGLIK